MSPAQTRARKAAALLLAFLLILTLICSFAACDPEGPEESLSESGSAESESPSGISLTSDFPEPSDESSEEPVSAGPDPASDGDALILDEAETTFGCRALFAWSSERGLLLRKGSRTGQLYPASLTKLVTALVALEYADPETECLAGDELNLVASDASIAYIPKGSRATLSALIEGMLLPSGCDASYVVAANVGRIIDPDTANEVTAVSVFIDTMNKWSKEHGLLHSNWMNPDGYHHDLHYTCLEDMLLVADMASKNTEIIRYTRTYQESVKLSSGEGNTWTNTNNYVNPNSSYYNPYCFGLKTGQTGEAGGCLLTAFQYEGEILLIGIFGSKTYNARFDVTNAVLNAVREPEEEEPQELSEAA